MQDENEYWPENGKERNPWFGPKRFGWGYRPQTWQGFLIVAALVVFAVVIATLTKGRSPLMALLVLPALGVRFLITRERGRG
jgi:hypothetical protein